MKKLKKILKKKKKKMKEKNDELEIKHKKQMVNLKEQYDRECKEIQKKNI